MKKVYQLMATATLSLMAIGVIAQSSNNITRPTGNHPLKTKKGGIFNPKKPTGTTQTIVLNYDSADATIWDALSTVYVRNQGELMNMHYAYPADTVGGNADVLNYFTVAFDSLVDPYNSLASYTANNVTVDTVYVPYVHVNNSGVADTLEVQINAVNAKGYPTTTSFLKDTMIISNSLGGTNSDQLINFASIGFNYTVTGSSKFAVTVKYYGAKKDSLWFIYGFGSFSGTCQGAGPFTLADSTNFSAIKTTTGKFYANSFTKFANSAYGYLPTAGGGNVYYDCNSDSKLDAGDGRTYYENINVFSMVTFTPTGVNEVSASGLNVSQNYPNPFNRTTQINYSVTKSSDVVFNVYDVTGRKIVSNNYTEVAPGQHIITLGANQFTPGVYFYTFNVNGNIVTKRMVITE
ncbi:MAG TPA: T9SS type A sorting domain-containing protein [Bacteroidia bacterium]|nr:T9SS type A sorting domain-containing protein [Bacteroidia bacterium]